MSQKKETVIETKPTYAKTRGEHFKDMVIVALIVAIVAFIGGMNFQSRQQDAIDTAIKTVAPTAQVQEPAKK